MGGDRNQFRVTQESLGKSFRAAEAHIQSWGVLLAEACHFRDSVSLACPMLCDTSWHTRRPDAHNEMADILGRFGTQFSARLGARALLGH